MSDEPNATTDQADTGTASSAPAEQQEAAAQEPEQEAVMPANIVSEPAITPDHPDWRPWQGDASRSPFEAMYLYFKGEIARLEALIRP